MKTREEVEYLKNNWLADPCYEVWEEEGFEEYRDELLEFATRQERKWQDDYQDRINKRAKKLGFTYDAVVFIELLEYKIARLQERLDKLEGD